MNLGRFRTFGRGSFGLMIGLGLMVNWARASEGGSSFDEKRPSCVQVVKDVTANNGVRRIAVRMGSLLQDYRQQIAIVDEILGVLNSDMSIKEKVSTEGIQKGDKAALEILRYLQMRRVSLRGPQLLLKLSQYVHEKVLFWYSTGMIYDSLQGLSGDGVNFTYVELYFTLVDLLMFQIEKIGFVEELGRNPLIGDLVSFAIGRGAEDMEKEFGLITNDLLKRRIRNLEKRALDIVTTQLDSQLVRGKGFAQLRERILFGSIWMNRLYEKVGGFELAYLEGSRDLGAARFSINEEFNGLTDQNYYLEMEVAQVLVDLCFGSGLNVDQYLEVFLSWSQSPDNEMEWAMRAFWTYANDFGLIISEDLGLAVLLEARGLLPPMRQFDPDLDEEGWEP